MYANSPTISSWQAVGKNWMPMRATYGIRAKCRLPDSCGLNIKANR